MQADRQVLPIGCVILFLIIACGRGAPPTPKTNPPGVETSLASTALALAKQTEAANPFTVTPSPTLTATSTPTPRISLNGTSLVLRDDKSTLFTDHKLGFQLVIPSDWLPVRINEDEYYKAFTLEAVSENAAMVDFLTQLQNQDPNYFRMVALDVRTGQSSDGVISGIAVILQFDTKKTLEQWAQSKSVYANLKGYQLQPRNSARRQPGAVTGPRKPGTLSTTERHVLFLACQQYNHKLKQTLLQRHAPARF
jgi:hypothetical protein